jgi:hypothetical protein
MKHRKSRWMFGLFSLPLFFICVLGSAHRLSTSSDPADAASATIRPEAIRADMRFLADDLLEGRGTGTRGHEIAATFVASEFEKMGLEPAGDNGTYFQNVPLRSIQINREQTTFSISRAGKEQDLVSGQDFVALGDPGRTETRVEAPLVFVGYGITAPEEAYDDYAGIDAKGKIVAYLFGAPSKFETAIRAHYSSGQTKAATASAHGAVGMILFDSPDLERAYPFKDRVRDLAFPDMRWLNSQGEPNDYHPELQGRAILSLEGTARMFESSGRSPEDVYAAANAGKPSSIPLLLSAKITTISKFKELKSPNVVARVQGSDPKLKEENVIYSAHLDHIGIREPVNGDAIYNGAMDNASGSASLLEIARAYSHMTPRPRRSLLFLLVTGEELGLLGSDYFAHYPTVAKNSLVADLNIDGNVALLYPIDDVTARGSEHSSLIQAAQKAATRVGLSLSPDPHPEQLFFIRSDQYSFVKQGLPSLFFGIGEKSSDPNLKPAEIKASWIRNYYHKPQDDMNQTMDFQSGTRFARYCFLVGYLVAQEDKRPEWNSGDFFGEHFGRQRH